MAIDGGASMQSLNQVDFKNQYILPMVSPSKFKSIQWCLPLEPQSNRHQKSMYIPNNVSLLNLHQVDTRNQCLLLILSPYITSIKKTHRNQCLLLMISPYRTSIKYTSKINVYSQWCLPTEPQSSRHQKSMSTPNDVSLQKLNQVDTRNQCLLPMMSPYRTSII